LLTESDALPTAPPSMGAADTPAVPTTPIAAEVNSINKTLRIDTSISFLSSPFRNICA
jgi:hypothetical protein